MALVTQCAFCGNETQIPCFFARRQITIEFSDPALDQPFGETLLETVSERDEPLYFDTEECRTAYLFGP